MGGFSGPFIQSRNALKMHFDPADAGSIISGSTTAIDLSGNLNIGSLNDGKVGKDAVGAATAPVSSSGVFHFDSTDYITVANSADFTFGLGEFAIEMWLKFTNFSPGGDNWVTALQHSSAEHQRNGIFLFYTGASPDLEWRMECNWNSLVSGTGCYRAIIDLDPYVDLNEWHMFTVSRVGQHEIKMYVDTTLVYTDTTADGASGPRGVTYESTWPDMNGDLLIADYRGADHHEFQGEIGPVRLYKGHSLNDLEIKQNYNVMKNRFKEL